MYRLSEEARDWVLSSYTVVGDELVWARDGYRRGVKAGDKVPAFINSTGYYCVKVNIKPRKTLPLHRVKWLVAYGEWPDADIDHINRDHLDNRLENLRLATRSQNKINTTKKSRDNGLPLGVYEKDGKYLSSISLGRERRFLGVFDTPEAAHAAWSEAGSNLYGEFMPCRN